MPPIRQKSIHVGDKTAIMIAFEEVNHLVYHNVLQAFQGLFGELEVVPFLKKEMDFFQ